MQPSFILLARSLKEQKYLQLFRDNVGRGRSVELSLNCFHCFRIEVGLDGTGRFGGGKTERFQGVLQRKSGQSDYSRWAYVLCFIVIEKRLTAMWCENTEVDSSVRSTDLMWAEIFEYTKRLRRCICYELEAQETFSEILHNKVVEMDGVKVKTSHCIVAQTLGCPFANYQSLVRSRCPSRLLRTQKNKLNFSLELFN